MFFLKIFCSSIVYCKNYFCLSLSLFPTYFLFKNAFVWTFSWFCIRNGFVFFLLFLLWLQRALELVFCCYCIFSAHRAFNLINTIYNHDGIRNELIMCRFMYSSPMHCFKFAMRIKQWRYTANGTVRFNVLK